MAKDYAKMYESRKGKLSGNRQSLLIVMVCLAVGAVAVLIFHGGISLNRLAMHSPRGEVARPAQVATTKPSPAVVASEDPVKFDFYSELSAAVPAVAPQPHDRPSGKPVAATPRGLGEM